MTAQTPLSTASPRPTPSIAVITPTIPGRESVLAECEASVTAAGLVHLIGVDGKREGPAAVRNRLVELVQTEWVLFLDDDDLLRADYAQVVAPHLPAADMVWTGWDLQGADDPQPVPLDPFLLSWRNIIPVTACVRTAVFRAVGGFNVRAGLEDHDLWCRIMLAWDAERHTPAYRMVYVPVPAWTYRRLPGSLTETEDRPWLTVS